MLKKVNYKVNLGCPADRQDVQDGIMSIIGNGDSSTAGFSINSFKFAYDDSELYFHCNVELCTENCEASCLTRRRKRRDGNDDESEVCITLGPVNTN